MGRDWAETNHGGHGDHGVKMRNCSLAKDAEGRGDFLFLFEMSLRALCVLCG